MTKPRITPAIVREAHRQREVNGVCPLCGASDEQRAVPNLPPRITGPEDVLAYAKRHGLTQARKESFAVILLDARHQVMRWDVISTGSLNASIVHPREVFNPAIMHSAASIVLVHNHPSGDPEPSEEDLSITKRLRQAGELVGVDILDHVIVCRAGRYASLRSLNKLDG